MEIALIIVAGAFIALAADEERDMNLPIDFLELLCVAQLREDKKEVILIEMEK